MANWLCWMAHFMRGGIVSDDAINMFSIMTDQRPEVFEPEFLATTTPAEVVALIREANTERLVRLGKRVRTNGDLPAQHILTFPDYVLAPPEKAERLRNSYGREYRRKTLPKEAGTIGYKLEEHAPHLIHNAKILMEDFGGDARNLFKRPDGSYVTHFEEFFSAIDYERKGDRGIFGMRRKIAALLHCWFEKFGLIPGGIPFPLVVDFHLLRALYSTGVISFKNIRPLVQSTKRKNSYPEALLGKDFIRVGDNLREEIMAWSTPFINGLSDQFNTLELTMATWILSRELCPAHPQTKALDNKTRYISHDELAGDISLQNAYPPLCGCCPVEDLCTGTFSSGPHYQFGILVLQKRFRYFVQHLPMIDMSNYLRPQKSRKDRGSRY
jgi:hypothetical protein